VQRRTVGIKRPPESASTKIKMKQAHGGENRVIVMFFEVLAKLVSKTRYVKPTFLGKGTFKEKKSSELGPAI